MERVNCLAGHRVQEGPRYFADEGLWDVDDSLQTHDSIRDSREAEWIYGADLLVGGANCDSVPGLDETFCLTPGLNYNEQVQIRHRQVCAPSGVLNVSHWVSVLRRVCWVSCSVYVLSCGPCSLAQCPAHIPWLTCVICVGVGDGVSACWPERTRETATSKERSHVARSPVARSESDSTGGELAQKIERGRDY